MSKPVVLIPMQNPPENYLYALKLVGIDFKCCFSPKNLESFAGLLLTGGGDVLSSFYNCNIDCRSVNVLRDVNEFKILDYFIKRNIPILGICRGMQLINVYLGGTLKNVYKHQSPTGQDVFHPISSTCNLFKDLPMVNSNHHQCVDVLFDGAKDVAFANDNTPEGFLFKNVLAVQYHPERMSSKAIDVIYGKFANLIDDYLKLL